MPDRVLWSSHDAGLKDETHLDAKESHQTENPTPHLNRRPQQADARIWRRSRRNLHTRHCLEKVNLKRGETWTHLKPPHAPLYFMGWKIYSIRELFSLLSSDFSINLICCTSDAWLPLRRHRRDFSSFYLFFPFDLCSNLFSPSDMFVTLEDELPRWWIRGWTRRLLGSPVGLRGWKGGGESRGRLFPGFRITCSHMEPSHSSSYGWSQTCSFKELKSQNHMKGNIINLFNIFTEKKNIITNFS